MLASLVLLLSFLYFLYYQLFQKRRRYPAGPTPLPFIGNIHQLGMVNPHKKIIEWSKVYGPVFTIWFGSQPNIVITDYQLLKDTLVKQGDTFAGRPDQFVFSDFRSGREFGVIINDGQIWKEQRRFALHVLRDFGFGKQLMEQKIMAEVDKLVDSIESAIATSADHVLSMTEPIELCVANIISSLLMGHTLDNENESKFRELKKHLDDLIKITSRPEVLLLGQYPWLRHLPIFDNFGYKAICHIKSEFHKFLGQEIQNHKAEFSPDMEPTDYTAAFLKEMHRRKESGEDIGSFTNWQLSVALLDMWMAGMETTLTTMKWALLYMVRHPEVQERCFTEVKQLLGEHDSRALQMGDRTSTPFLAATVAEIQRCANLVPINIQHATMKDAVIDGYGMIPKGTAVLPQISSVLLDERFFPDAEKFDPSRFLNDDGTTLKSLEMVIPFSLGKRVCLGESLARMELFLIFGTVIHKFRFSVPTGEMPPSAEPAESFIRAPRPYKLHVTSR